jgi:hypothetical protein
VAGNSWIVNSWRQGGDGYRQREIWVEIILSIIDLKEKIIGNSTKTTNRDESFASIGEIFLRE